MGLPATFNTSDMSDILLPQPHTETDIGLCIPSAKNSGSVVNYFQDPVTKIYGETMTQMIRPITRMPKQISLRCKINDFNSPLLL